MNRSTVEKAILRAKATRSHRNHDHRVSSEQVQIVELVEAYVKLTGNQFDPENNSGLEVEVVVLRALYNQELIAHTLDEDAVIPSSVWEKDQPYGEERYHVTFWLGWLQYLDERSPEDPFEGQIPFIPKTEAEDWLLKQITDGQGSGRPKIHGVSEAYYEAYPNGHDGHGVGWKEVKTEVQKRIGQPVSRDTIKRRLKKNGAKPLRKT